MQEVEDLLGFGPRGYSLRKGPIEFNDQFVKADLILANSLRVKWEAMPAFLEGLGEKEEGGAFLVQGERDEKVVAFGAYKLLAGVRDAAGIGLAVAPALRSMGIGALLIERLAVLAARHGVGRLVGVSATEAKPLIGLFRSSGFEPDVRNGEQSTSFLISTRAALKTPGSGRAALASSSGVTQKLTTYFMPRTMSGSDAIAI